MKEDDIIDNVAQARMQWNERSRGFEMTAYNHNNKEMMSHWLIGSDPRVGTSRHRCVSRK